MIYNEDAFLAYMADSNRTISADYGHYLNALFDMTDKKMPTVDVLNDFMGNVQTTGGGKGMGARKLAYRELKDYADYCTETGEYDFVYAYEEHIRQTFEEPVRKKMNEFKSKIEYIPDGTAIDPKLLQKSGLSNDEFVKAFRDMQEIVHNIYDAIERGSPFEWGWSDWMHLTVGGIFYRRIIATLNMLAHYNELDGNTMIVCRKSFFSWDWNKLEKGNSKTTLVKMAELGFNLEGIDEKTETFKISCTINPNVMRVIHSLEQKMEQCGNSLDYRKIQDPATLPPPTNFAPLFHQKLMKYKGVEFDWNAYYYDGKRIARLINGKKDKVLRLWLIKVLQQSEYSDAIATLSAQIKKNFIRHPKKSCPCNEPMCYKDERNEQVVEYTYEGKHYEMCHKNSFAFKDWDIDLVPVYLKLLELEYDMN